MIADLSLRAFVGLSGLWNAATPKPKVPNADSVTPGVWGFVITFMIAVVTVLLILDMTRRIRRTRYRAEIAEKLDAEHAANEEQAADAGNAADNDTRA